MFQPSSEAVQNLRNQFIKVMDEGCDHANPDEEFDWNLEQMSAAQLATLGRIYLSMAEWKLSYSPETFGETPDNQDGVRALGDEFPSRNQVTEFPEVA